MSPGLMNMSADQSHGRADKTEITDTSLKSEGIFRFEGNKSAYSNPPYAHSWKQGQIRLWDRLILPEDPDRFVLFLSALSVLLFKYSRNEKIAIEPLQSLVAAPTCGCGHNHSH